MNALQFDSLLYELAIRQDHVSSDVKSHLRVMARDDSSLDDFLRPGKQQLPNGQVVNVTLEDNVDRLRESYAKARPVEQRNMDLRARESQLRGDLFESMLYLDTVIEPGDIRDLVRYAQALLQNPQPGAIAEALDLYRDAINHDTDLVGHELHKRLQAEFVALYPPDEE
jgi:hypothetical protein